MNALIILTVVLALYCGWVCGRSHERYHHDSGSILWFGGRASGESGSETE